MKFIHIHTNPGTDNDLATQIEIMRIGLRHSGLPVAQEGATISHTSLSKLKPMEKEIAEEIADQVKVLFPKEDSINLDNLTAKQKEVLQQHGAANVLFLIGVAPAVLRTVDDAGIKKLTGKIVDPTQEDYKKIFGTGITAFRKVRNVLRGNSCEAVIFIHSWSETLPVNKAESLEDICRDRQIEYQKYDIRSKAPVKQAAADAPVDQGQRRGCHRRVPVIVVKDPRGVLGAGMYGRRQPPHKDIPHIEEVNTMQANEFLRGKPKNKR